jgi:glycine/D-amino acid oxidase-like deaminating enzyme/nitrite reductase/ring-hydroxylating ferredoxin subunit
MHATRPLWSDLHDAPHFGPLQTDELEVDVAVVGGGVTGLTAAWLLKKAGRRVAVLEARDLLSGTTGGTTAHLTQVVDTRYHELASKFGKEGARLVAESNGAAISLIERLVAELGADSAFERVPGYLYAETAEQLEELERELAAAVASGLSAVRDPKPPVPFKVMGAIRVDQQAQVDPRGYLLPLAQKVMSGGSFVFEQTRVRAVHDGATCTLETESGRQVRAAQVILATHSPLNQLLLQTKVAHSQSYVVSGPCGPRPSALLWDLADPYHYARTQRTREGLQLIIGGEDHPTGQASDTETAVERLIDYARRWGLVPDRCWSAQVVEPVDGLPFIGRNGGGKNVYVATGYSGNGMTFGTIAAMVLTDLVLERANPWAELYQATRIKPLASMPTFLEENVHVPIELLKTAFEPAEAKSLDEVAPDEGKIVSVHGKRVAVYRDPEGVMHAVSSICTHLGCRVRFNSAQRSWDCPCHGSRFGVAGQVLDGPAIQPLAHVDLGEGAASSAVGVEAAK